MLKIPEVGKMSSLEGRGLLDLFWELMEASPKRRTYAACKFVRYLLQHVQTEDNQSDERRQKGRQKPPGFAVGDGEKVQSMLTAPEGSNSVPYELQYAVNRLFQGLASPNPCTCQAYAMTLLLLLQQLQHRRPAIARVDLSAFCQNLRCVFSVKQAAPSELKQLHLGRCLGVYILLSLGFFRKKQSLPEVQEVLEMLWEAFHGKLHLQEASGFLIRQVLRQLAEMGEGALGLEACERRLRGLGTSQLISRVETVDKTKAEVGKTATGRLPCSLLELYLHLQADVQEGLLPDAEWLHTDIFSMENLPSLVAFLRDTAAAHPRLHGLWGGVFRLLLLRRDAEKVFLRFWAAVDSQLFPPKSRGSEEIDTGSTRPQEQSHQSAFVGFRAALLLLHFIKQRLLLPNTGGEVTLAPEQLERMAFSVFTEGKGFLRVLILHLESPRSPLHAAARFITERLEEAFSHQARLGAAQGHPLSLCPRTGNGEERGFVKTHRLPSVCSLGCGCQTDPYIHGLLEPLLGETKDESEHLQPFGEDFKMVSEPLLLQPEDRIAMLLAFGVACRFQPLKRQSLWRLASICFSSARADELEGLAVRLFAAFNETPDTKSASTEEQKRKTTWLLDSLLMLPQLLGNRNADGGKTYLPDWLISATLCSCSFAVLFFPAKKVLNEPQLVAAAIEASELTDASQATIPEGVDEFSIPVGLVQLPQLFLFDLDSIVPNSSKHVGSKVPFAGHVARTRIQGKLCYLLGSSCTAAMERCTRVEGSAASDFAQQLHCAHSQLFQLMERMKTAKGGELELRARAISSGERGRKAKVLIASGCGPTITLPEEQEDMEGLRAFCYFTSSQGASLAAAAGTTEKEQQQVHAGFVAAAQVVGMALCALSLLPYLLSGGSSDSDTSETAQGGDDGETEAGGVDEKLVVSGAAGSAARAFVAAETQTAEAARQEECREVLDASLHALRQLLLVVKPLYMFLQQHDQEQREAAVAAQAKAAAISSSLLLLGGNSAASGLLREVAGGLWRSFSCFAPRSSITSLLGIAAAAPQSPSDDAENGSLKDDESEDGVENEQEESSTDESEEGEESSEEEHQPHAEDSEPTSDAQGEDAADSSDELEADPSAVQLSTVTTLKILADNMALPDMYCPQGGFKQRHISQRKLLLQQRRRFGELRLRALSALQVYVHCNSSSLLALNVLTSLYTAFSRVLVRAAQSRKRKQKLQVYDDLANKIRRTIEMALKGITAQAWQANSANASGSNSSSKPQRRTSSITMCYQILQGQRLQVLLQKRGGLSRKEPKLKQKQRDHQLQSPPLMPTLEDDDRMHLLLTGKGNSSLLCDGKEGAEEMQILGAFEQECLFVAQTLWTLLAEEMVNIFRVCSRKLPQQLARQNQILGAEMLLQLSKLEQQVYGYYATTSVEHPSAPAAVCNSETIITQLLSVALAARSQLRRCYLGQGFFETLAERRPELFRFCDVYGLAISARSPFVRRELAQVAFRSYRHPDVASPVAAEAATAESNFRAVQKRLSTACVLTSLLSKRRSGVADREQQTGAAHCQPLLMPRKAMRSPADFAIFVVSRVVELLKETSEAEIRPQEQPKDEEPQQKQGKKRVKQRVQRAEMHADEEDNGKQMCLFSSAAQKQAAVCEQLKQLQQLIQVFARRDQQQTSSADGSVQKGFKEKLHGRIESIEQTLKNAAAAVGGKKPSALANTISALLSRIAEFRKGGNLCKHEAEHPSAKGKRKVAEDGLHSGNARPLKQRKEKSGRAIVAL